jgi:hypothetical protein
MRGAITRIALTALLTCRIPVGRIFCMTLLGLSQGLPLHAGDYKFTQINFQPLLEPKRRFRMKNKIRIGSFHFHGFRVTHASVNFGLRPSSWQLRLLRRA